MDKVLHLELRTICADDDATLGALYVDNAFMCFTLEDAIRDEKIAGRTAIPGGVYEIELRKGSPMARKYDRAYRDINHEGMLWLRRVPGFEYIYLHTGNGVGDTEGCILLGESASVGHSTTVGRSRKAYRHLYPILNEYIKSGYKVTIEIIR